MLTVKDCQWSSGRAVCFSSSKQICPTAPPPSFLVVMPPIRAISTII